ncbi:MAG: ABC transporter substrate-binding protein [Chloroflexota bacterium]|nr:ABC transporter substrate-binding protein [Chloroflexota bacterium]
MGKEELDVLAEQLAKRQIDRRQLMQRAAALGVSASALGSVAAARPAAAQDQGATGQAGGVMTVSQEQQATWVRNFNPFNSENSGARWPTHAGIYEPLVVYNTAKGEIVPWLATGYQFSDDNMTLTFTIREGVQWSDGEPFTARDVAFTHNMFREHEGEGLVSTSGATAAWGETGYLSDVQAPDDRTVVFTFNRAFTPAIYDLGQQPIVPEHIWRDVADPVKFANENPVATGPFTEVAVFQNQIWELHRNPNYWQEGKPFIQGMRFPAYPGNDQANLATINGENDWAGNFIPDIEETYVAKDPEHFHYWFPSTGATVQLYLNTTKPPFDDPNVRKAVSMAINRDQIVTVAMYDYTHPSDATGLSDAYEQWRSEQALQAGTWVNQDVDQANQLLDAAGLTRGGGGTRALPDGTPLQFDLNVVSGWTDWVSSVQIISQNLEEIGIAASVKTYDFNAWSERVQKGEFDMSIGWSSGGAVPFYFYRDSMSQRTVEPVGTVSGVNWHRFGSEQATQLLDQFANTSDPAQQQEIAKQLQMVYVEQAPAIPLFPGPQWGEFNTTRFTGFPDETNPYALLSTYQFPDRLILMTTVRPVE